jgi:hypothetical protein
MLIEHVLQNFFWITFAFCHTYPYPDDALL